MKKKKKLRFMAILASFCIAFTTLTGCVKDSTADVTETSAATESQTSASSETQAVTAATAISDDAAKLTAAEFTALESTEIVSVTADITEGERIATTTTFTIEARIDAEPDQLKKNIKLMPDIPFELEKKAAFRYTLRPLKAFDDNIVATISVQNGKGETEYRWAFQTTSVFAVKNTYPNNGADYADLNTGIEIYFNFPVNTENAEDYFEISPKVYGRFESHRNTLYFIPSKPLEKDTSYTVQIKKGFTSDDGIALEEDYSFSFKTSSERGRLYFYAQGISESFIEGDPAVVEVFCSDTMMDNDYDVKLYRYDSSDAYYNAMKDYVESGKSYDDYEFSTEGLEEVYSKTDKIIKGRESWDPKYILLPDNLENGCYFAKISTTADDAEFTVNRLIQVSPVSVYASSLSDKVQFFINSTENGNAIANAEIELFTADGTFTAKTDSDGIAELSTPEHKNGTGLLKIKNDGSVYCDFFDYYSNEDIEYGDLFYTFLYTDRAIYQRDDTIKIFGAVIPRKKGVEIPSDLNLRLGSYYDEASYDIPFTLNDDGTFTTEISFTDTSYSWGTEVCLRIGEDEICRKYVRIQEYVKPEYTFETDIPFYAVSPQTEPVKATVNANLFDGTAADGITFDVDGYYVKSASPSSLVTDEKGYAETEILFKDKDTWKPQYNGVSFNMTGVQNEYSDAYTSTICYFRDVMLEADYDKDSRTFTVNTSSINYDKTETGDYIYSDEFYEKIRGSAADVSVRAVLKRSWSEKKKTGTYYDYLLKQTFDTYDYEFRKEVVDTYTIDTVNGKGVLTDLPVTKENSSYWFELEWKDTQGRKTTQSEYIYTINYYNDSTYKTYTLNTDSYEFTENQQLEFTLCENNSPVEDSNGRILFQVYGTDFISNQIYDTSVFKHAMTADYIPTVRVAGAYFDGKHVYPINPYWSKLYSFDPQEREIKLEITPDKEKYAPGENATVTVRAADISGNAISGAAVTLSIVDEAAFAVANQTADPLNDVYEDIYPIYVNQYCSYIQHVMDSANTGEMGGGGDGPSVRKDFKDTAAFLNALTDKDGKAVFSFTLPDNITEWRATAVAVYEKDTDLVYAGASKHPVIATLPIFLEAVMLPVIIEGDDLTVSARCFGDHSGNEKITVNVVGDGVNETKSAVSNKPINFGKLKKGDYTVTFTAEDGDAKDIVELPLTVTDTILETNVTAAFDLADGIEINPTTWPVRMTFLNKDYMLYTDVLYKLSLQAGDRTDMYIASLYAGKEFGFIDEEQFNEAVRAATSTGLAKILNSAAGDPILTAKICAAAPDAVSKSAVTDKMYDIISSKDSYSDDVAAAYLALAALGEPVMTEIRSILETEKFDIDNDAAVIPFNLESGLKLTAALALLGDYDNALKHYEKLTSIAVESKNSNGETMVYLNGSDPVALTQTAILTAAVTHHDYADSMARYLVNTRQVYDSFALELMVYLNNYSPDAESEASFSYNLNGEEITVDLDRHFGTHIEFNKEQYQNADLKVVKGNIYTVVNYNGNPSGFTVNPRLKVTKEIKGDLTPGSLVTVQIKVTGGSNKNNYYTVNDVIPSCGRYDSVKGYYARREGQRITLYTDKFGNATYYFRIASSGEYVVESACAQNYEGKWGISERSEIYVE